MIAKTGKIMDTNAMKMEVPVSTVEITGFPNPPVDTVDASLAALEVPAIAAAVPPPAMMANAQVIS